MAGAESNVSSGRKKVGNSLMKQRRQSKQQMKMKRGKSARAVVEATNEAIPNPLDSVMEATQKKRQQLLISDKAHGQTELSKVKWTTGIRPAKVGKHGITIRATKINKKKIKKLLRQTVSTKAILEAVNANEIEMD